MTARRVPLPLDAEIAFSSYRNGNRDIYVMNADGSRQQRITRNTVEDWSPKFSPDGRWMIFPSLRVSGWELVIATADGSKQILLTEGELTGLQPSWRPRR